jgi:hypothetical protein
MGTEDNDVIEVLRRDEVDRGDLRHVRRIGASR